MTYSPLIDEAMPPTGLYQGRKKWSARPAGVRINGLNVHHWATTTLAGLDRLVKSADPASANYLILNSGRLIGSVPEEYRAWTTSSYAADDDKITVEIQNETGAPEWRISTAAMATLIRLYADLARRHQFAPVRANLRGHQEYGVATACPGPYLLPRLGEVAVKSAALDEPAPTPTPQEDEDDMFTDKDREAIAELRKAVSEVNARSVRDHKILTSMDARLGGSEDGPSLARLVINNALTPAQIAAAVPAGLAQAVVDELNRRLEA